EHLAGLDTVREELLTRSLDAGDDQVQILGRAGRNRRDARAELDRASGARRRKLNDPEAVTDRAIGVKPPPEPSVELLRPVDIRDGYDDHLELHVRFSGTRRPVRVAAAVLGRTHRGLPGLFQGRR